MFLKYITEMGSYFSKNECNDVNVQEYKNAKDIMVSYAPKSDDYINPIPLVLKYIGKENIIEEDTADEDHVLLVEDEKSGNSLNGFLPIIKYIGRTNNLYPNKNYFDCALVDTWLDRFMNVKTLNNLYKKNKISGEHYFDFLKDELENFSTHNCNLDYFFIENFYSPTISDFCWYSFLSCCVNDASHNTIIKNYNEILDYVNRMDNHIKNVDCEQGEEEESEYNDEEEESKEEGEEESEEKEKNKRYEEGKEESKKHN